jgi:hypothetical protein
MRVRPIAFFVLLSTVSFLAIAGCTDKSSKVYDGNPMAFNEYPEEYLPPSTAAKAQSARAYDNIAADTLSSSGLDETYLIIANEKFKSGAERLKEMRERRYRVVAEYVASNATSEDIRSIVLGKTSGFAYVVLIGTCKDLACFTRERTYKAYINGSKEPTEETEKYFSDNYYADFTDDQIPEISIGRLPVATEGELSDILDKIQAFEDKQEFTNNHYIFAGGSELSPEERKESPGNIWHTGSYFDERVIPSLSSDVDVTKIYCYCHNKTDECKENTQQLIDGINEGAEVVTYAGHGAPQYLVNQCCNGAFGIENIQADLHNAQQYPIFISLSCSTADLLNGERTIAEDLVIERGAGAVAYIGASGAAGSAMEEDGTVRGMYVMSDALFSAMNRGGADTLGKAFWMSKQIKDDSARHEYEIFHLFGDPALKIR